MKSLKKIRSQLRGILQILALFSVVVNVLLLTVPLYLLRVYDQILPSRNMDALVDLSIIAGGALFVLGMLEAVRAVIASRAAAKIETMLGADAVRVSMIESRSGNAGIQPIRDLNTVKQFVSSQVVFSLMDMLFVPLFIGILYMIHPALFWLTLGGAVALIVLSLLIRPQAKTLTETVANQHNAALTTAQSMSENAQAFGAMGITQNAIAMWGSHEAPALIAQGKINTRTAILSGLSRTIRLGTQIAILGVGALLVFRGELTLGMMFASLIIAVRGLQPIDQVIGGWGQITQARRSWRSLTAALENAGDAPDRTSMPQLRGEISVEGATIADSRFPGSSPILNRVSFTLQPGSVLGVVGPSGAGKSTLAQLLVANQAPHSGRIRIDGTEIKKWDPVQLGQHIGYLGQEMDLLPGTIAQNIARLAGEPDSDAVVEAAKKAQIHELIEGLPHGYDTKIGHGGIKLSGGQRQRVGLARAFYGNPKIMVLDEPDANLDEDGELALQRAVTGARNAGATIVIITQCEQLLDNADMVLRLNRGIVEFFGTRETFVDVMKPPQEKTQICPQKAKPLRKKAKKPPAKEVQNFQSDLSAPLRERLARARQLENERDVTLSTIPVDEIDLLDI